MEPKSLIVVISYNSESFIEKCLNSVVSQDYHSWFLLVVDNNSTDLSLSRIREFRNSVPGISPKNFKLLKMNENYGFAGAIRKACWGYMQKRLKDYRYIIFLNPDLYLDASALGQLIRALEGDRRIGVAGGLILDYEQDTIQHLGGLVSSNYLTTHIGSGKSYSQLKDKYKQEKENVLDTVRDVRYVTGAMLATRTELFTGLGGFDTGYRPAYFEELDYCLKCARLGYRVAVNPLAMARHAEAVTLKKYSSSFYHLYHKNRIRCAVLNAKLPYREFWAAERKWVREQSTADQKRALRSAYAKNFLLLLFNLAVRIKNHFILNRLKLK